jgi:VanZ family protein
MAGIFAASSLSSPPVPGGADKPWHALAYCGLSILVVRAFARGLPAPITLRTFVISVCLAVFYGVTDEVHQMFVAGRTASIDDLFADTIGALIGAGLCWAWGIITPTSRNEL